LATRLSRLAALIAAAALLLLACAPRKNTATAAGSTAFLPFAEKLAEEFMLSHPGYTVTVQGGGSAVGIQAALSGAAQIGMADMVSLPEEARDLDAVAVARDGVALVVHPSNPIGGLDFDQIRGIYNGAIRNWKGLGWDDRPITVVSREAGSGTRSSLEQIVKGIELMGGAIIQDSNGTIRETVANDPSAIGYISHGLVNERVKPLTVNGVPSTTEEVIAGRYPLVRPVYFLTRGVRSEACQAFIDYVLSAEGQKIIRDNGLIPVR
jgi:phosphate transport system substrate-binding protein